MAQNTYVFLSSVVLKLVCLFSPHEAD